VYLNLNGIPKNNYKNKIRIRNQPESLSAGTGRTSGILDQSQTERNVVVMGSRLCFCKAGGKYGTDSPSTEFMNHTGNMGNTTANNTPDLYREITLNLPTTARVTAQIRLLFIFWQILTNS
jgi:hypothetical protein